MIQWVYTKRVYIWSVCLLAAALFIATIHFYNDWVNAPGNDFAIILLLSLWLLSALAFYLNAVAYAVYEKRSLKNSKLKKGIIISFFSIIMLAGIYIAIWVMTILVTQR